MKELNTNDKEIKKYMINQYDIEIILDEFIAIINGKYQITNFFSMYKNQTYIQILKPKLHYYKYNEKEIVESGKLWELKIGYYKITRKV